MTTTSTPENLKSLKLEDFVISQDNDQEVILGQGSFATVYLAVHSKTKKKYAIKVIKIDLEKTNSKELENIRREIKVHKRLSHPSIIKLHSYEYRENKVFLILEYAEKGNLFNFLKKLKTPLPVKKISQIYKQICSAILEVHKLGMVHRDLKPENILLDKNMIPKICDFGWSVEIGQDEKRGTFCGTYEYMAPEIYENEKYNVSVDVWSLGILLYEMFHGFSPFGSKSVFKIYRNIVEEEIKIKPDLDLDAKDLIFKILKTEPGKRPSVREILNHNFIKKFEKDFSSIQDQNSKRNFFLKKKENLFKKIKKIPIKKEDDNKKKILIKKKIEKSHSKSKYKKYMMKKAKKKNYSSNMNIYINKEEKQDLEISIDSYDSSNIENRAFSSKDLSIEKKLKKNSSNLYNNKNDKKNLYEKKKPKLNKSGYLNFKTFQDNGYISKNVKKDNLLKKKLAKSKKKNNNIKKKILSKKNYMNSSRLKVKKKFLNSKLSSLKKFNLKNDLKLEKYESFNSEKKNSYKSKKKYLNNSLQNIDLKKKKNLKSKFYNKLTRSKKNDSTGANTNYSKNDDSSLSKDNFGSKKKKTKINDILHKYLKEKTKFQNKKTLNTKNSKTLKNNDLRNNSDVSKISDKKINFLLGKFSDGKKFTGGGKGILYTPQNMNSKNMFQSNYLN